MKMIPKQIGLFLAPWCFVWIIAIGCSQQNPGGDHQGAAPQQDEKLTSLVATPVDGLIDHEQRYRDLVQANPDPAGLRRALVKFYEAWGRRDGEAAANHALAQNHSLIQHVFSGWLAVDPNAPRQWVLSHPGSDRRRAGLARDLLHALPPFDHQNRADWVGNFAGHQTGSGIVSEVAIAWGNDQPQETLGWLAGLPEGDPRTGALETIFQRWTLSDPEFASTHLTRMPAGGAKDLAIGALAKAIYRDDPEAATLWADTISDEALRERTNGFLTKLTASSRAPVPGP